MSVAAKSKLSAGPAEIAKQRGAVVDALDKLFVHEVPAGKRVAPRLVWPRESVLNRDPIGEGLRAFITRRGWDLWLCGGDPELFAAVRAIMTARPERRMWNRTQLSALWGDIGECGAGRR